MENSERLAAAAAIKAEFDGSIPADRTDLKFEITKRRKSQTDNSVTSVMSVKDVTSDVKYTFTITIAVDKENVTEAIYDRLVEIQKHDVAKFLNDIHDKL